MAKPKERSVTLRVVFTMKRAGEEKGEAAFPLILKRIQTVLGEKYDVLRLELLHGDIPLQDDDRLWFAGERWGDTRAAFFGPMEVEEEEPEPDLAAAYAEQAAEADAEDHDLEVIEASEHAPSEPDDWQPDGAA